MHILLMLLLLEIRKTYSDRNLRNQYSLQHISDEGIRNLQLPPTSFQLPIDFHNLKRSGHGDIDFKQPVDFLSYSITKLREPERKAKRFKSPRDEMLYYKKLYNIRQAINDDSLKENANPDVRERAVGIGLPKGYDFETILARNIEYPQAAPRFMATKSNRTNSYLPTRVGVGRENFQTRTFSIKQKPEKKLDWTSCDEFAKGALFHPNDVVNTEWIPFYIWSKRPKETAIVYKFSFPTQKLVQHFKDIYDRYTPKLDWRQPKLYMKEFSSYLLVAGDRRGLFFGMVDRELPDSVKGTNYTYPLLVIRMKIIDPYLAMMHCDDYYATIMAEVGSEPATWKGKNTESAVLRFRGTGNPVLRDRSHEMVMKNFELEMKNREQTRKSAFGADVPDLISINQ